MNLDFSSPKCTHRIPAFKMESLACAIQLMKKNCFMASLDLIDTYYTVPVAVEHRKCVQFLWRSWLFQYTST